MFLHVGARTQCSAIKRSIETCLLWVEKSDIFQECSAFNYIPKVKNILYGTTTTIHVHETTTIHVHELSYLFSFVLILMSNCLIPNIGTCVYF